MRKWRTFRPKQEPHYATTFHRAWLRFARVYHRIDHRLIAQLRARDLSLAQFDVLSQVGASEGLTQQVLADRLLVTKGNICQLLDRMEDADLLVRRQDGRSNRIYLTAGGRRLVQEVLPEHETLVASLLSALTLTSSASCASCCAHSIIACAATRARRSGCAPRSSLRRRAAHSVVRQFTMIHSSIVI
jgi:DNA-binding MarR family transcriptional regulator